MIETASSWALPDDAAHRREPARPIQRRPANFAVQFDVHTIFYDCFRMTATQVMLIGPPLNRFNGVLDSLTITSLPAGSPCRYKVEHKFTTAFANRQTHNVCRVVVDVPPSDTSLHLKTAAGETVLPIRPGAREVFHGRRVLLTLSKNNDPAWICDWMRFHRDLQTADAVLLYDNGSTNYSAQALLEAMSQVSGFKVIRVMEWPFKYGPQGIGRGTWDSAFCQDGALEDARWRFLAAAYAVLSCDIDEFALSEKGNLFDQAALSKTGYVKFAGRWVNSLNMVALHRESTYQLLPQWRWKAYRPRDLNVCPAKWAVVPNRCPQSAHWSVHEIVGMRDHKLRLDQACYRHFRQMNTNWKNNRTRIEASDRAHYKEDAKLREAFARVNWSS